MLYQVVNKFTLKVYHLINIVFKNAPKARHVGP